MFYLDEVHFIFNLIACALSVTSKQSLPNSQKFQGFKKQSYTEHDGLSFLPSLCQASMASRQSLGCGIKEWFKSYFHSRLVV